MCADAGSNAPTRLYAFAGARRWLLWRVAGGRPCRGGSATQFWGCLFCMLGGLGYNARVTIGLGLANNRDRGKVRLTICGLGGVYTNNYCSYVTVVVFVELGVCFTIFGLGVGSAIHLTLGVGLGDGHTKGNTYVRNTGLVFVDLRGQFVYWDYRGCSSGLWSGFAARRRWFRRICFSFRHLVTPFVCLLDRWGQGPGRRATGRLLRQRDEPAVLPWSRPGGQVNKQGPWLHLRTGFRDQ